MTAHRKRQPRKSEVRIPRAEGGIGRESERAMLWVEGMATALEPKRGVAGIGMVGTENTCLVTTNGGKSLIGNHPGLMVV